MGRILKQAGHDRASGLGVGLDGVVVELSEMRAVAHGRDDAAIVGKLYGGWRSFRDRARDEAFGIQQLQVLPHGTVRAVAEEEDVAVNHGWSPCSV